MFRNQILCKGTDEKLFGVLAVDAAALQVVKRFFFQGADRVAVRAGDIIVKNFEGRFDVNARIIGKQHRVDEF